MKPDKKVRKINVFFLCKKCKYAKSAKKEDEKMHSSFREKRREEGEKKQGKNGRLILPVSRTYTEPISSGSKAANEKAERNLNRRGYQVKKEERIGRRGRGGLRHAAVRDCSYCCCVRCRFCILSYSTTCPCTGCRSHLKILKRRTEYGGAPGAGLNISEDSFPLAVLASD